MSKKHVFLFLCISILFAYPIFADEYHNQQVLVGEKAAGLGGTFVALGDGAEACYYNPAGLTQLKISYLSVSSQIFEYKEIRGKFLADSKEKITSMSFVPSFWGIAKDLGEYKIGFSIVVPKFDDYKMHEQYSNLQMGNLFFNNLRTDRVNNNKNYLIGPSIAKIINPKLSVGTTVYFNFNDIVNRTTSYYDVNDTAQGVQAKQEINSENSGRGLGFAGIIGMLYKPVDFINVGLSLKTGSRISNTIKIIERNYYFGSSIGDANGIFENKYVEEEIKYTSIVPPSIVLGAKWQTNKKLTLVSDISYHFSSNYDKKVYGLDPTGSNYQEELRPIELEEKININFGSEYMLDNYIPLRLGFYTDRSTSPKVSDSKLDSNGDLMNQELHVDNYGVTINSGVLSQNSTLIFGVKYGWGSGKMVNKDFSTGKNSIDKVKSSNYAFNLSGSYNF